MTTAGNAGLESAPTSARKFSKAGNFGRDKSALLMLVHGVLI
jgi:hypothetical protein